MDQAKRQNAFLVLYLGSYPQPDDNSADNFSLLTWQNPKEEGVIFVLFPFRNNSHIHHLENIGIPEININMIFRCTPNYSSKNVAWETIY